MRPCPSCDRDGRPCALCDGAGEVRPTRADDYERCLVIVAKLRAREMLTTEGRHRLGLGVPEWVQLIAGTLPAPAGLRVLRLLGQIGGAP